MSAGIAHDASIVAVVVIVVAENPVVSIVVVDAAENVAGIAGNVVVVRHISKTARFLLIFYFNLKMNRNTEGMLLPTRKFLP